MIVRSKYAMLHQFALNMIWIATEKMYYHQSKEYIADGKPYNKELFDEIQPYLKVALIVMTAGRLILVLLAQKWP